MGFRSTMITEDATSIEIPDWFFEKYPNAVSHTNLEGKKTFCLAIVSERKFYSQFKEEEIFIDIQNIIKTYKVPSKIVIILLHECGGITRIEIWDDKIIGSEPTEWKNVESVGHNYCYGCSDIKI